MNLWLLVSFMAFGSEMEHELRWDITLDNKPVGHRTAQLKYTASDDATERRILQVWTEVDASIFGIPYTFRERLTAHASNGAAAFHSVSELNDVTTEVQARKSGVAWTVTVGVNGRETTREWPTRSIDLSTADILDPDSTVPVSELDSAKILSAETGDMLVGPVLRLGPSEISIDGQEVAVQGYAWDPPEGTGKFWYSAEGFLVRYELKALGKKLVGTLVKPPPKSLDEAPVTVNGTGVQEIALP